MAKKKSDAVKELVQRALDRVRESHKVCSAPNGSDPNNEGTKAIARLTLVLEGQIKALEAVHDAMYGNKFNLRFMGDS